MLMYFVGSVIVVLLSLFVLPKTRLFVTNKLIHSPFKLINKNTLTSWSSSRETTLADLITVVNKAEVESLEALKVADRSSKNILLNNLELIREFKTVDLYTLFKYDKALSDKQEIEIKYSILLFSLLYEQAFHFKSYSKKSFSLLEAIKQKDKILNSPKSNSILKKSEDLLYNTSSGSFTDRKHYEGVEEKLKVLDEELKESLNSFSNNNI